MNGVVREEIDAAREDLIRILAAAILVADSRAEAEMLQKQMFIEIGFRSSEQIELMERGKGLR
ncbi:hypothetical protein C7410_115195 [Paraburkholderia silvatlantica]|uniref:Uncharacterized protein n=1 Tax=Paraburkholderia silvatlantica TaxID=321895 RepID=A0A2V4TSG0_9BURK|nr:hypothetical protein [Paraburkholderia silvatlantica]PYE21352.1 hypothetical protein C7410_115195 [Paraburkholderia silvatlantica]